jgi:hypothetical protein
MVSMEIIAIPVKADIFIYSIRLKHTWFLLEDNLLKHKTDLGVPLQETPQ